MSPGDFAATILAGGVGGWAGMAFFQYADDIMRARRRRKLWAGQEAYSSTVAELAAVRSALSGDDCVLGPEPGMPSMPRGALAEDADEDFTELVE